MMRVGREGARLGAGREGQRPMEREKERWVALMDVVFARSLSLSVSALSSHNPRVCGGQQAVPLPGVPTHTLGRILRHSCCCFSLPWRTFQLTISPSNLTPPPHAAPASHSRVCGRTAPSPRTTAASAGSSAATAQPQRAAHSPRPGCTTRSAG